MKKEGRRTLRQVAQFLVVYRVIQLDGVATVGERWRTYDQTLRTHMDACERADRLQNEQAYGRMAYSFRAMHQKLMKEKV